MSQIKRFPAMTRLLVALVVLGCRPAADLPEEAPADASTSEVTSTAAAPDQAALERLLTCHERGFLSQPPTVQRARLADWPELTCGVEEQGGPYVSCEGSPSARLFGLPVSDLMVAPPDGELGVSVHLSAPLDSLRRAAERALGLEFTREGPRVGSVRAVATAGDPVYDLFPLAPGASGITCGLLPPDAALETVRERSTDLALVSGRLSYPSEYIPAMRVCAVQVSDPGYGICVETPPYQRTYTLEVRPGQWWVLAWPRDTGTAGDPGAYTEAVSCLAEGRAGCDDGRLRVLDLAAGQQQDGVDILDWYNFTPAEWPMEPRGETLPAH